MADKLINIEISEDTLYEANSWGITEPVSNEDSGENYFHYVITPLLYCDGKGNRVGYGKGFYDGLFQSISPETKKSESIILIPMNMWMMSGKTIFLDYLVTPTEVLSFLSGLE
ncbi:5-formyltetrahydrofolate cyclo-ligase [Chryseobacterium sp. 1B4]